MSAFIDAVNRWGAEWTTLVAAMLWQSTLVALVVGAVAYALKQSSPAMRYWLWQIVAIKLLVPRHGDDLYARGILYAPDYAINAGGLVNVAQEVKGYDAKAARDKTLEIYNTIWDICERSKRLQAPTYKVADIMVEEKLAAVVRKH